MQLLLNGLWQLSPLTDLSIPQDDLTFPGPLSAVLPNTLSEPEIAQQEWHLMHDIEVTEEMLNHNVIELVVGGVDYHAEVRLNGVAMFDCDGRSMNYRKDVRSQLTLGRNRIEMLFLEEDDDEWFDDQGIVPRLAPGDERMGVWRMPYLQFSQYVRLETLRIEQIWHPVGGCEVKVDLTFAILAIGLVSAKVKFNGMTLTLPLDLRQDHATALFQIDAPVTQGDGANYSLAIEIDGYQVEAWVPLSPEAPIQTVALSQL
jgi:hypothetical protein